MKKPRIGFGLRRRSAVSWRHRLIAWLAMGDGIILNIERTGSGVLRPKELGDLYVINVELNYNGLSNGILVTDRQNEDTRDSVMVLSAPGRRVINLIDSTIHRWGKSVTPHWRQAVVMAPEGLSPAYGKGVAYHDTLTRENEG